MSPLSKAMPPNDESMTPVQEFYRDATILVTGGTGFLGKVLIEKLLRSCPLISQIILLIRDKKELKCEERLETIVEEPILKGLSTKERLKLSAVSGDCSMPGLGLSDGDRQSLIKSVTIVFHVAATVRFDEELSMAVAINILGTQALMDLARDMSNLKAFVHVSTAYSQSGQREINEQFYSPYYCHEKLIQLTKCVDKPYLEKLTPILLKATPNTYVYTKAIAEDLIRTQSKGLPIAVFRPSIVVATRSEPFPGWIDNLYGPTGVVVATTTGVMHTLHCDPNMIADLVPADMVVNAMIATAWRTHLKSTKIEFVDSHPEVFNFVSSPEKPIRWTEVFNLGMKYRVPTVHAVWHPVLSLTSSHSVHRLQHFFWHLLPAIIVDSCARVIGRHTNLLKITRKVDKFSDLISYFCTHEWKFSNGNVQDMWETLSPEDRKIFPFSFRTHNWEEYFQTYMKGIRMYLLKDDMATEARAKARDRRFFWLHHMLKVSLLYFIVRICWWLSRAESLRLLYLSVSRVKSLR